MNEPTSESINILGAVCLEHALNGGFLPIIGGPITLINIDGNVDRHVDLGLFDSLEDEMRKVTIRSVGPNAL